MLDRKSDFSLRPEMYAYIAKPGTYEGEQILFC